MFIVILDILFSEVPDKITVPICLLVAFFCLLLFIDVLIYPVA